VREERSVRCRILAASVRTAGAEPSRLNNALRTLVQQEARLLPGLCVLCQSTIDNRCMPGTGHVGCAKSTEDEAHSWWTVGEIPLPPPKSRSGDRFRSAAEECTVLRTEGKRGQISRSLQ